MIKLIIYVIIGVFIISVLGVDLKRAVESPQTRENFSYVSKGILFVWEKVLEVPFTYVWEQVTDKIHDAEDDVRPVTEIK